MKSGELIRRLRIRNGWSQDELAHRAGYTDRSSIAKIEKNEIDLSSSKLAIFADIFGITPAELLGYSAPSDVAEYLQLLRESPETRVLLDVTRGMDAEEIRRVANMIEAFRGGVNNKTD